jgi:hypothetical protein
MPTGKAFFDAMAKRLSSVPLSVAYLAAAVPVLTLSLTGVLSHPLGLVLGLAFALTGLWHLARDNLRWRAVELTRPRERKALARALRNLLRSLELPPAVLPTPVNRPALRRNRRAVEALARRLAEVDRPVRPRGVLLVRQLLGGSPHSPLYDVEAAGELHATLAHVRSEIELR